MESRNVEFEKDKEFDHLLDQYCVHPGKYDSLRAAYSLVFQLPSKQYERAKRLLDFISRRNLYGQLPTFASGLQNVIFLHEKEISRKLLTPFIEWVSPLVPDKIIKQQSFYYCPISNKIMSNPVITESGYTFDESSIQPFIKEEKNENLDPIYKKPIGIFIPNLALKYIIEEIVQKNPKKAESANFPFFPSKKSSEIQASLESPDFYCCPISLEIMEDPVVTNSGHSFDKKNISKWMATNPLDPITKQPIVFLRPNILLKQVIDKWVKENLTQKIELPTGTPG